MEDALNDGGQRDHLQFTEEEEAPAALTVSADPSDGRAAPAWGMTAEDRDAADVAPALEPAYSLRSRIKHEPHFVTDISADAANRALGRVNDIPLEISVELGRSRLLIRDVLALNTGSIVELDKAAGEPVDLLANGALIARGEVVVIGGSFAVRLMELIPAAMRDDGEEQHARAA